jgi:aminoglycoside/choline kinase family phosphotransferase
VTGAARDDDGRRIERYLESALLTERHPRVAPLAGDASDRRYFRLTADGLSARVLALYPRATDGALGAFVDTADLLVAMGLPAPRVIGRADELGVLVLEDLGDVSLQAHLAAADPLERAARYREAIELLVTLQSRGAALASPARHAYQQAFDAQKLGSELDFFRVQFLEGHRGVQLSADARAALDEEFARLATLLAADPRVLCHRDYHSRNLMVQAGRLRIIDFQDARLGPDTYDLASLLCDAYVEVSAGEAEAYRALFLDLRAARAGGATGRMSRRRFMRRFHPMAVQRTLKALGTFGYQAAARGNPAYLAYVPRTLTHARAALVAWEGGARMRALLAAALPEMG